MTRNFKPPNKFLASKLYLGTSPCSFNIIYHSDSPFYSSSPTGNRLLPLLYNRTQRKQDNFRCIPLKTRNSGLNISINSPLNTPAFLAIVFIVSIILCFFSYLPFTLLCTCMYFAYEYKVKLCFM